jgi:tRNA threonylcarbamoyl adenosine modification protein YeaZ
MKWCAIETSSSLVSLAIGDNDTCLREVSEQGNASTLIESLYRKLDVDFTSIDHWVISQGPGSYNGLRVGYAFLKGLLCLDPRPIIEVSTPLVMAFQAAKKLAASEGQFVILNNARQNEIYRALIQVNNGLPRLESELMAPKNQLTLPESPFTIVSYDFQSTDIPNTNAAQWLSLLPSAADLGRLAYLLKLPATSQLSALAPYYVRPPVTPTPQLEASRVI